MANASPRLLSRRRLVKSGAGARRRPDCRAIRHLRPGRGGREDRTRQSVDRPLASLGKNELTGVPDGDRRDQRQGRHPRPSGRADRRGLDQRRRRDRGAEGAQADRPRQDRFSARQRELGAFARDGRGFQRGESPPHRARRPHRRRHRRELPLERVSRLQHDPDGGERGRRRADQGVRKEILLHHARLRVRPHAGSRTDQSRDRARRHENRRRSRPLGTVGLSPPI